MVDERRVADGAAGRGFGQNVYRAIMVTRLDRFFALRVDDGGHFGAAVAGAKIGLLRIGLRVPARAANTDRGGRRHYLHL